MASLRRLLKSSSNQTVVETEEMNVDIAIRFVGVAVLIGLNAFFVAVEFAVVASRRTRVEQLVAQGSGTAKIVLGWVESQKAKDKLIGPYPVSLGDKAAAVLDQAVNMNDDAKAWLRNFLKAEHNVDVDL